MEVICLKGHWHSDIEGATKCGPSHLVSKVEENPISYDRFNDVITIYGMKYAMDMFKHMAFSPTDEGRWYRILKREDGVITVEVKKEEPK